MSNAVRERDRPATGWTIRTLAELSRRMRAGGTPRRGIAEYWDGDVPFVKIEDITAASTGEIWRTSEFTTQAGLANSNAWLIEPGAVLVAMYATIGAVAINRIPVATNQAILAIEPDEAVVDPWFLYYALRYTAPRLASHNIQTTQKNVSKAIVERFEIEVPPLEEQRAISSALHAIQQAGTVTENVILAIKQLRAALLRHLFTYGPTRIDQVEAVRVKDSMVGLIPEHWDVVAFPEAVSSEPFHVGNVKVSQYKSTGQYPVIDQGQRYIAGYWDDAADAYSGPLPVVIFGDHTRALKFVDFPFVCGADGTKVLIPRTELFNPEFLFYALGRLEIQSRGYNRHFRLLLESHVPCPPIPEQREVVAILAAIDRKLRAEEARRSQLGHAFVVAIDDLLTARRRLPVERGPR